VKVLEDFGFCVSRAYVNRLFRSWGLRWKKVQKKHPNKFTAENQLHYQQYLHFIASHTSWEHLKFLDESHFVNKGNKTSCKLNILDLVRQRALSAKGEPAISVHSRDISLNETYSVTLLCSINNDHPIVLSCRQESNTQYDFLGFVKSCVELGYLEHGDFLILDNATIHKGQDIAQQLCFILESKQIKIIYLPTYSPELNPCELIFANVKRQFRDQRTEGDFRQCIYRAFQAVPFETILNYYIKCITIDSLDEGDDEYAE
jgi:hypothetical protein